MLQVMVAESQSPLTWCASMSMGSSTPHLSMETVAFTMTSAEVSLGRLLNFMKMRSLPCFAVQPHSTMPQ